jgi:hypothetical protein
MIGIILGKVRFPVEQKYSTSRILLRREAAIPAQAG